MNLDRSIFHWLFGLSGDSPLLDAAAVLLSQYVPYALGGGIIAFALLRLSGLRSRLFFLSEVSLALILGRGLVAPAIAFFYHRASPAELVGITPLFTVSGPSFPSGYAVLLFALATTLFCFDRRWGWWYGIAAAAVGIARLFAGAHWPLDIIVGVVVGIGSALLIHALLRGAGRSIGAYVRSPEVP